MNGSQPMHGRRYGGWTDDTFTQLIETLADRRLPHAAVMLAAIEAGGFISRWRVLDLIDRPRNSRLGNWIKPMHGVIHQMRCQGDVEVDAVDPLVPVSDGPRCPVYGYQVPPPIVLLITRAC